MDRVIVKPYKNNQIVFKAVTLNFLNICRYYPKLIYMSRHTYKYTKDELYNHAMKLMKLLVDTAGIKVEAYGLENIPEYDNLYFCCNHQDKFDPLAVWYTFPRQVGVILADSACHRPFIKEMCCLINSKKLIHSDLHSVLNLFSEITAGLKNNENFMIFPEGEYASDIFNMQSFHAGCFKSPVRAKSTIIPVALIDSYRVFDKGFKTTKPIQIHYLKPIKPEEYANLSTSEVSNLVKSRIKEELNKYQL